MASVLSRDSICPRLSGHNPNIELLRIAILLIQCPHRWQVVHKRRVGAAEFRQRLLAQP